MPSRLSPVEPSETMYTLQRGELNAGFVFFALALLATLVFGRFVCGWGCHVVALQDLCGWLLKKCGLRPKAFRITFLIDDARHTVVMLTAFRTSRDNEVRQKERAYRAAEQCLSQHTGAREHDVWSRTQKGGR